MVAVSGIHHLALFICHLFIDGHFRTAHFVYKPNTFDYDWLLNIDAVCPEPIPLYLTDITLPWVWPWNGKDTHQNVLQLCFFDPNQLFHDFNELKSKGAAYHRVFLFNSTDLSDRNKQASAFKTLRINADPNNLIVHYNPKNISVYWNDKVSFRRKKPILTVDDDINFDHINIFDRTFGESERTRTIAIHHMKIDGLPRGERSKRDVLLPRFYHLQLNNSYIELMLMNGKYKQVDSIQACTIQHPQKFYKEFTTPDVCTDIQYTFRSDNLINLYMYEIWARIRYHKYSIGFSSRHPIALRGLLIYGTDFKREINFLRAPASAKLVATLIALFLISATIILYIFRRRFRLPGDSLSASFFDCLIPFIGGGNLRMENRFERWFFGIMLVGAFFFMSVFGGDLVDSVVRAIDSKIRTFDELGERHPHIEIFSDPGLLSNKPKIIEMLRGKMGVDVEDVITGTAFYLNDKRTSSLSVYGPDYFDFFVLKAAYNKQDYDILEEPLGEVLDEYILSGESIIPPRMIGKIDQLTISMVEHGFDKFFESLSEFDRNLNLNEMLQYSGEKSEDLQSITIDQLWPVIVIVSTLNGLATIIFVAEILYFKWRNWRDCRVQILPFVGRQKQLQSKPRSTVVNNPLSNRSHTAPPKTQKSKRKYKRKCRSARF